MGHLSIKLAIAGMDHRSQLLFRKNIELHLQDICELVEIHDADAALIDMDTPNSKEYWDSLRDNFPEMPLIALSIRAVNQKNTIYLRKPIQIASLTRALQILFPNKFLPDQQSSLRTSHAAAGGLPDAEAVKASVVDIANSITDNGKFSNNVIVLQNNNTKWDWDGEVFDTSAHLISYVVSAVKESGVLKKISKITFCNDKIIIVDPCANQIYTNMSESMLRSMAIVAINGKDAKVRVEYIGQAARDTFNPNNNASFRLCKVEAFLWSLAISTARGRAPLELHDDIFCADKPVYMQYWPNLTRLEPIPYAQQVTALFTAHPRTLADVASLLNIDVKHVVNLFYASAIIGCAGQAKRPSDKLFAAPDPGKANNSSILSAIMKRLRGMGATKVQTA